MAWIRRRSHPCLLAMREPDGFRFHWAPGWSNFGKLIPCISVPGQEVNWSAGAEPGFRSAPGSANVSPFHKPTADLTGLCAQNVQVAIMWVLHPTLEWGKHPAIMKGYHLMKTSAKKNSRPIHYHRSAPTPDRAVAGAKGTEPHDRESCAPA